MVANLTTLDNEFMPVSYSTARWRYWSQGSPITPRVEAGMNARLYPPIRPRQQDARQQDPQQNWRKRWPLAPQRSAVTRACSPG